MGDGPPCFLCGSNESATLLRHLQRCHKDHFFSPDELQETELVPCLTCGKPFKGANGLKGHSARGDCRSAEELSNLRPEPRSSESLAPQIEPALPQTTASAAAHSPTIETPSIQAFRKLAVLSPTYVQLYPQMAACFADVAERLAAAFIETPSADNLFHILCLPKIGLAPGLRRGIRYAARRLSEYPNVSWPEPDSTERADRTAIVTATRFIETGRIAAATKVLEGSLKAIPVTSEVLAKLRELHPQGPVEPFAGVAHRHMRHTAGILDDDYDFLDACIKTFPRDTAPGISGWTLPLLYHSIKRSPFRQFIVVLTRLIARGEAPGRDYLRAARLTPIGKEDGGIRPIAVGDLIDRLCGKLILRKAFKPEFLLPCQFGVGSRGGVEPMVHLLQKAIDGDLGFDLTHLAVVDISNAFNTTDRRLIAQAVLTFAPSLFKAAAWAYGSPTELLVREGKSVHVILSSQGVRQGDPWAALFFSLALRPILKRVIDALGPEHTVLAYHDDVAILGPNDSILTRVSTVMAEVHPTLGTASSPLQINISKSKTMTFDHIRQHGFKFLGTMLGSKAERRAFLDQRTTEIEVLTTAIQGLPHQHALLALRLSVQQRLRHLQRSLPSADITDCWERLDNSLSRAFKQIRGIRGDLGRNMEDDDALIQLPIRLGGAGILSFKTCAPLAYAASLSMSETLLGHFIPSIALPTNTQTQRERCHEEFTRIRDALLTRLTPIEVAAVLENASVLGRRWLSITPTSPIFRLSDYEIAAACQIRTLTLPASSHCNLCGAVTSFLHFDVCPGRRQWLTRRHELIKYAVARALSTIPGAVVRVEPYISGTVRRDDIRFTGSAESGSASFDLDIKVTSLGTVAFRNLLSTSDPDDSMDAATGHIQRLLHQSAEGKRANHPPLADNAPPFHPFILSSGGCIEDSAEHLMQRWKAELTEVTFDFMCKRISIGLVRARAQVYDLAGANDRHTPISAISAENAELDVNQQG